MKKLIILTGHPGSGKTSIARQLSQMHSIPYISKDAIKEHIFDNLGSKDKEWSLKVSAAAHRVMDDAIRNHIETNNSIIVESNFKLEIDSTRFAEMVKRYDAQCLQILCVASPEVLFERWVRRIKATERHAGHAEAISLEEIRENFKEEFPALKLPGDLVELDTTDFTTIHKALSRLPVR